MTTTGRISGSIQIDLDNNTVQVKDGLNYKYLTASQVISITIMDKGNKKVYQTLPFGQNQEKYFFEILSFGHFNLLYREGLRANAFETEELPPYFIALEEAIYPLEGKKQILGLMEPYDPAIKSFLKDNGIDLNEENSLIYLFEHINQFAFSQQANMAAR